MKKMVGLLLVIVLTVGLFSGCSNVNSETGKVAVAAAKELKGILKNPSSLIVNEISVAKVDPNEHNDAENSVKNAYRVKIDYSAENGFGGHGRSIAYAFVKDTEEKGREIGIVTDDKDSVMGIAYGIVEEEWENNCSENAESIDAKKLMNELEK